MAIVDSQGTVRPKWQYYNPMCRHERLKDVSHGSMFGLVSDVNKSQAERKSCAILVSHRSNLTGLGYAELRLSAHVLD